MSNWLVVKGKSMAPYFKEGDKLFYSPTLKPSLGNCIVFSCGQKQIVHRYLAKDSFKGDMVKRFDQEIYQEGDPLVLEGVITHRLIDNKLKTLENGLLVRFLSLCSNYNHANVTLFHRFYATIVKTLGYSLRLMENVK